MSKSSTTISNRFRLKLVLLGDQSTGKTSIIHQYISSSFTPSQDPTVGVDFLSKNISHQNRQYRLQLWDTAGQQRFKSLIPNYLRNAGCSIFVFDLASEESVEGIGRWVELDEENRGREGVRVLCGNKKDLMSASGVGENIRGKVQEIKRKYGEMVYVEVSAKTGEGVEEMFEKVIEETAKRIHAGERREFEEGEGEGDVTDKPLKMPISLPKFVFQYRNDVMMCSKTKGRCC